MHSNTNRKRYIYQCNAKYETDPPYPSTHVTEEELKHAFVVAINEILPRKKKICDKLKQIIQETLGTKKLDEELSQLLQEEKAVHTRVEELIAKNAQTALDQDKYNARYEELTNRCEESANEINGVKTEIARRTEARIMSEDFIKSIEKAPRNIEEFDDKLLKLTCGFRYRLSG